jgi:hypothetical protein
MNGNAPNKWPLNASSIRSIRPPAQEAGDEGFKHEGFDQGLAMELPVSELGTSKVVRVVCYTSRADLAFDTNG